MAINTKDKILDSANKLFIEYGFDAVSMRDIAKDAEMSVGNLTYHFKKKQEIIEALILKMSKNVQLVTVPRSLKELDGVFKHIAAKQSENVYYLRQFTQLAQISPMILKLQIQVFSEIETVFNEALKYLQIQSIIKKDEIENQLESTTHSIMLILLYWQPHMMIANNINNITQFDCLWTLLYPLLTDTGKKQFKEQIET